MISILKVLERSSFHQILEKPKAIVQVFFLPSEKKFSEK